MYTTHFDTHVTDNMEIPPFKPEIRENRLYGRGSCDAKGSIAAMIMSARPAAADGLRFFQGTCCWPLCRTRST